MPVNIWRRYGQKFAAYFYGPCTLQNDAAKMTAKNSDDRPTSNRFDTIPEYYGPTNGRTDGRYCYINITRCSHERLVHSKSVSNSQFILDDLAL